MSISEKHMASRIMPGGLLHPLQHIIKNRI